MAAPYDMRQDPDGWTVYDIESSLPVRINDVPQTGLSMDSADDLADLLNHLEAEKQRKGVH